MKTKIMVMVFCGSFVACFPVLKTPVELAKWSNCNPSVIAGWQGSVIKYQEQAGYATGNTIMKRKWGDCKGYAVLSHETLDACGVKNHIVQLSQKNGAGHVLTVFTLPGGERGYINGRYAHTFPASTSWNEIINSIDGGKWTAVFAEEK